MKVSVSLFLSHTQAHTHTDIGAQRFHGNSAQASLPLAALQPKTCASPLSPRCPSPETSDLRFDVSCEIRRQRAELCSYQDNDKEKKERQEEEEEEEDIGGLPLS